MTFITIDLPVYSQEREAPRPSPQIDTPQTALDLSGVGNTQMNAPEQSPEETNFKKDVVNAIKTQVKSSANKALDATEETVESITQHKYARLAQASYDYFQSKGDPDAVIAGLKDPEYSYIEDLSGFEMDNELSTIDNLVLHNPQTGETVVSYRGSTIDIKGEPGSVLRDWKTNAQIAGGKTNTQRVREAEAQFDRVVSKYGKENLATVGHSQGGHISFEMGQKFDVPSYSYNPAVNGTQVERAVAGEAEHMIYKTPLDFASPHAYRDMPGVKTNVVKNLKGKDSVIDTHSLDQFAPKVEEVVGEDAVKVVRRTMAGSVVKGVGHALNVAAYGYTVGSKIAEDVKEGDKPLMIAADVLTESEKFIIDGEILGVAVGLAGATGGVSLLVGAAAVYIHDHIADQAEDFAVKEANVLAKEVKSVAETSKKAARSVQSWFKRHF